MNISIVDELEYRVGIKRVIGRHRMESITKKGPVFEIKTRGDNYTVEGGVSAGGSRTDWFLDSESFFKGAIKCNSAVECLDIINNS